MQTNHNLLLLVSPTVSRVTTWTRRPSETLRPSPRFHLYIAGNLVTKTHTLNKFKKFPTPFSRHLIIVLLSRTLSVLGKIFPNPFDSRLRRASLDSQVVFSVSLAPANRYPLLGESPVSDPYITSRRLNGRLPDHSPRS